ncbi:MAG: hypothetical protein ACOYM2_05490 [Rectinemataceae bacterium]
MHTTRRALAILVLISLFFPGFLAAEAPAASDGLVLNQGETLVTTLLSIPVAFKIAAPLVFTVQQLSTSNGVSAPGLVLSALWTLPNSLLMASIVNNDAKGIALWRGVNLGIDGLSFVGIAGYGAWVLAQPRTSGSWNDLIGLIMVIYSVPFAISFGLDFIPYPIEAHK